MGNKNIKVTKVIAFIGTVLIWLPILFTLVTSVVGSISFGSFRMDFLMPAELFPMELSGALLLMWASIRSGILKAYWVELSYYGSFPCSLSRCCGFNRIGFRRNEAQAGRGFGYYIACFIHCCCYCTMYLWSIITSELNKGSVALVEMKFKGLFRSGDYEEKNFGDIDCFSAVFVSVSFARSAIQNSMADKFSDYQSIGQRMQ